MRIYLDSAPIIYMVEKCPQFSPLVSSKLAALGGDLVSSDLALLEALVVPLRNQDSVLINEFELFFAFQLAVVVDLPSTVYRLAARIRADFPKFKTPDAIHLAAAVHSGCDRFLTNDTQLVRFTSIIVEVV